MDAQNNEKIQAATESAEKWLGYLNKKDIEKTWHEASSLFQGQISKEQWKAALDGAHKPIGDFDSRSLQGSQYTQELPGAPDGEYVLLTYNSRFEHKKQALETVIVMLDKDACWRVSGYFIK